MLKGIYLTVFLLAALPAWSQVEGDAAAPATNPGDDMRMITPAPVSGDAYQTTTLSEDRSNYLRGSLLFNTAYSDNATVSATGKPISDVTYSIWPSLTLDETNARLHTVLTYSPGFTFYQRLSGLDQTDQSLGVSLQYRFSPHVTLNLSDSLHKSSSAFNQPDFLSATPVSGSALAPVVTVIAPVADQLRNTGNAELTYQFSANEMVGASGSFSNLHYPDSSQVPGLFDSNSAGGALFYTHRLARRHYLGATYQYQRIVAYPVGPDNVTQTHAILGFYTISLKPTLSLSFSGGPQYSILEQSPLPSAHSLSPAETVSLGWRARRTSLAASYSHVVSGGGGLVGAFRSSVANTSIRQQLTKTWTAGVSANYSIYATVNPLFSLISSPGGHSIFGTASLQHEWGQHVHIEAGYTRLHQSYGGIPVIATVPNTNREYVSVAYQFSRPLGR